MEWKETVAERLLQLIKESPNFVDMDFVRQERITAPVTLRWLMICINCINYHRLRLYEGIKNHLSVSDDDKAFFTEVLQQYESKYIIAEQKKTA